MIEKVRQIVPPLKGSFHKGQLGRVAVIGGSADYTGAPYFSAMASARLGCDLSHVVCEPSAGQTIKSYSPNLMVSPMLRSSASAPKDSDPLELAKPIFELLPKLHSVVIGPGLGRDPVTQKQVTEVLKKARAQDPPLSIVLDADGLMLANENPDLIKGYKDVILTPNVVEFGRLAEAMGVDVNEGPKEKVCETLAKKLGGVCIVQKGEVDYISNGSGTTISDLTGGKKRSGGQGDTLTGSLGTWLAWRQGYHDGLWGDGKLSRDETLLVCAWAGSAITRECSRRAFEKRGRSLQASDLTDEVHGSFMTLIGDAIGDPDSQNTKL